MKARALIFRVVPLASLFESCPSSGRITYILSSPVIPLAGKKKKNSSYIKTGSHHEISCNPQEEMDDEAKWKARVKLKYETAKEKGWRHAKERDMKKRKKSMFSRASNIFFPRRQGTKKKWPPNLTPFSPLGHFHSLSWAVNMIYTCEWMCVHLENVYWEKYLTHLTLRRDLRREEC